jgi:hypothetical protein
MYICTCVRRRVIIENFHLSPYVRGIINCGRARYLYQPVEMLKNLSPTHVDKDWPICVDQRRHAFSSSPASHRAEHAYVSVIRLVYADQRHSTVVHLKSGPPAVPGPAGANIVDWDAPTPHTSSIYASLSQLSIHIYVLRTGQFARVGQPQLLCTCYYVSWKIFNLP